MAKMMLNVPDSRVIALLKVLEGFSSLLPDAEQITIELAEEPKREPAVPKVRQTVQYRAIAGADALEAIGPHTVQGIIYSHLLKNGPCTEKDIRESKTFTKKSVESALDKLKTKGVVVGERLGHLTVSVVPD